MAIASAGVFGSAAVLATKQRWNATGSSLARIMRNWSCEGGPLAKGRKRRRSASLAWPQRAMSAAVSAPRQHHQQHLVKRIGELSLLADSPASHRNAPGKQSFPSPRQKPRPLRHRPILHANHRIATDSAFQQSVMRCFSQSPCLEIEICRQMAIPGLKGDWGADENCRVHVDSAIYLSKSVRQPFSLDNRTLRH